MNNDNYLEILPDIPIQLLEDELRRRKLSTYNERDKINLEEFKRNYPDHELKFSVVYDHSGDGDNADLVRYWPMIKRKTLSQWHNIYYYEDRRILDRLYEEDKEWYDEWAYMIPSFLEETMEGEYESRYTEAETRELLTQIGFEVGESYHL